MLTFLIILGCFAIATWMAGALFYDVAHGTWAGWLLVVLWLGTFATGFLWWQPTWKPALALLSLFGAFLCWWFSQRPSNDREWHPLTARLPYILFDGDIATIENVRNAQYRIGSDCSVHYETRTYHIPGLQGVDALICFWGSRWMCHPMFVFDFGRDGRICFSVEVRYRTGQKYSFLRSLYRQQELIYLACDERDAILHRTMDSSSQDVYLYRMQISTDKLYEIFYEYAESINGLKKSPRWYHGLTSNCTISLYHQRKSPVVWDWRLLVNGSLEHLFYEREMLDQSLPFETLKRQSWLNDVANEAPSDRFGDTIRDRLPAYRRDPF